MNCSPFPTLETERLILRQLNTTDAAMIQFLRSDELVNLYVKRPKANNLEEAKQFIDKINTSIDNNQCLYWAITLKPNTTLIGTICLWNFSTDKTIAEVGYDLNPAFQQQGVMTEALSTILKFGFTNLQLKEIEAFTHRDNISSKKLLVKNGFTLIENRKDKNNFDNIIYTIKNYG